MKENRNTNSDFTEKLEEESKFWVSKGLIESSVRKKILALYGKKSLKTETKSEPKKTIDLPRVLIVLASICLILGITIFYASNWRKMPPTMKLIQVFALIIGTYGASFVLFSKEKILWGRVFLNLGMVSFGVAITLVSQIYHISAQPTNGLLLWGIAVLAMSALMRERAGYYGATLLFFIRNCWEVSDFGNPSYEYIVPVVILAWLFYKIKDRLGIVISAFLATWYFFQINFHWITISPKESPSVMMFLASLIPFGLLVMLGGKLLKGDAILRPTGSFFSGFGVFLLFIVFAVFPISIIAYQFPVLPPWQTGEYVIIFILAMSLFAFLRKREKPLLFYVPVIVASFIFPFMPLLSKTMAGVVTNFMAVAISFCFLLFSNGLDGSGENNREDLRFEKSAASVFTILLFVFKFFEFILYSGATRGKLPGFSGAIILCTLFFVLNQVVSFHSSNYGKKIIAVIAIALSWIAVYSASFKMTVNDSFWDLLRSPSLLSELVPPSIVLFMVLTFGFHVFCFVRIGKDKLLINISLIIFALTSGVLLLANSQMSWIVYSIFFNGMLFVFTGAIIYYSTVVQSRMMLNVGVALFLLHMGTRYFDLFWDMLSGSLLFIVTGIIGLGGGFLLERKRQEIVKNFSNEKASDAGGVR